MRGLVRPVESCFRVAGQKAFRFVRSNQVEDIHIINNDPMLTGCSEPEHSLEIPGCQVGLSIFSSDDFKASAEKHEHGILCVRG